MPLQIIPQELVYASRGTFFSLFFEAACFTLVKSLIQLLLKLINLKNVINNDSRPH